MKNANKFVTCAGIAYSLKKFIRFIRRRRKTTFAQLEILRKSRLGERVFNIFTQPIGAYNRTENNFATLQPSRKNNSSFSPTIFLIRSCATVTICYGQCFFRYSILQHKYIGNLLISSYHLDYPFLNMSHSCQVILHRDQLMKLLV